MRTKALIIGTLLLGLSACATMPGNSRYHSKVLRIDKDAGGVVSFKPYDLLAMEAIKASEVMLLDSVQTAQKIAEVPLSGCIYLEYTNLTSETTNLDNLTYVVWDCFGKEVYRADGKRNVPAFEVELTSVIWRSNDVICLQQEAAFPITFFMIDKRTNTRSEFRIYERPLNP